MRFCQNCFEETSNAKWCEDCESRIEEYLERQIQRDRDLESEIDHLWLVLSILLSKGHS